MAFLAFEGLDGAGKSTLIQGVTEELQRRGLAFVVTREPGGTDLGRDIRSLLLRTDGEAPVARSELLLYQADRAQHVERVIKPCLARDEWVLCDRFTASTRAFQVGGRGLSVDQVEWLSAYAIDDCTPDLWVLLDLPVEESEKRMSQRETQDGQGKDRFELEERSFHQRVRQHYLQLAKTDPDCWLVLDATLPASDLLQSLLQSLQEYQWLDS